METDDERVNPEADEAVTKVLDILANVVKVSLSTDLTAFPLCLAKLWIVFNYLPKVSERIMVLTHQYVKTSLKLPPAKDEIIKVMAANFSSDFGPNLDEETSLRILPWKWKSSLELEPDAFEFFQLRFLTHHSLVDFGPDRVDETIRALTHRFEVFWRDFDATFTKTGLYVPPSKTGENNALNIVWPKIVFILRMYKYPAGSQNDYDLWKGIGGRKFFDAKAKFFEEHPTVPFQLIYLVITTMEPASVYR